MKFVNIDLLIEKVKKHWELVFLFVIVLFSFHTIKNVFTGMPAGWDHPPHFTRVWYLKEYLLPHLKVSGWFPYWYCGFPLLYFYPPLAFLVPVLINALSLESISLLTSYQITIALSHCMLPVTIFILTRSLKLSKESGIVAALLSLAISSNFSGGLVGSFAVGLFPNSLGITLFPLVLASFIKLVDDPTSKKTIFASFCLAAVMLTHLLSAYFTLVCIALLFFFELVIKKEVKKAKYIALACVVSLLLSLFWITPFRMYYDYTAISKQPMLLWARGEQQTLYGHFKSVLLGTPDKGQHPVMGSSLIGVLGLAGLLSSLIYRKNSYLVLLFVILLYLSLGAPDLLPNHPPFYTYFTSEETTETPPSKIDLSNKDVLKNESNWPKYAKLQILLGTISICGLLYLLLKRKSIHLFLLFTMIFYFAMGAQSTLAYLPFHSVITVQIERIPSYLAIICCVLAGYITHTSEKKHHMTAVALTIAVLFVFYAAPKILQESKDYVKTSNDYGDVRFIQPAMHWVKENTVHEDRFGAEFNWDMRWSIGSPHYLRASLPMIYRQDVAGLVHELSPVWADVTFLTEGVGNKDLNQIIDKYQFFGVTHVMSWMPPTTQNYRLSSLFQKVYENERISIFKIKNAKGIVEAPATIESVNLDNEQVTIQLKNVENGTLLLKITHFPNWKAFVNGKKVMISKNQEFMTIPLEKQDNATIEFVFSQSYIELFAKLISFLTAVAMMLFLLIQKPELAEKIKDIKLKKMVKESDQTGD